MGDLIDDGVAGSSTHGSALATQAAIEDKYGWQEARGFLNNPTLNVLRYTEALDGVPSRHIQPTRTQVNTVGGISLASMPCTVDDYSKTYEKKWGGVAKEGDKIFVVYDLEVDPNDRVQYDEELYGPVKVEYDANSGRCEFVARVVGDL